MNLPLHREEVAVREKGHRDLLKNFNFNIASPNGTFFPVRPIPRPLILCSTWQTGVVPRTRTAYSHGRLRGTLWGSRSARS